MQHCVRYYAFRTLFFFEWYGEHRDLHVLTPSSPTRRAADLGLRQHAFAESRRHTALDRHLEQRIVGHRQWSARIVELNGAAHALATADPRSEEHTSELQSLLRISSAVFCSKKKKHTYAPPSLMHNA